MSKTSLADLAANKIRELILDNRLGAGGHINIASLSREFAMSQTPIREALQKLISEGFVVYVAQIGYAVRNLTLHEYLQVFEIHQALEIYLVSELAKVPFLVDFDALNTINDEIEKQARAGNLEKVAEGNDAFHRKLYENYHNKLLVSRLADLWTEVRSLRNIMYNSALLTNRIAQEHRAILNALKAGNARKAAEAMDVHYRSGREGAIMSFPVAGQ